MLFLWGGLNRGLHCCFFFLFGSLWVEREGERERETFVPVPPIVLRVTANQCLKEKRKGKERERERERERCL